MIDLLTIINALEAEYPQGGIEIRNISDVHLGQNTAYIHQYIFGIAPRDPGQNSYEHYKTRIVDDLRGRGAGIGFMGWAFDDDEWDEVEEVLRELARQYQAALDITRMVRDFKKNRPSGEEFYLVVSVNRIPVLLGG